MRHLSAVSFLEASEARLMRDEAENNLLIGIAHGLAKNTSPLQAPPYLATVTDRGALKACGIRLAPYKLVVTRGDAPAMEALARDLFAADRSVDGVSGPEPSSQHFAMAWAAMSGVHPRPGIRLRVHQARGVKTGTGHLPAGALRLAVDSDVNLLAGWIEALSREANPDERPDAIRVATDGVRKGRLYVWEDGSPMAMAGWAGKTPSGVRLNLIYAPPPVRARGYQAACVGALTRLLLDEGKEFCWLYTDRADSASADMYERIGYEAIADLSDYLLSPALSTGR